MRIGRGFTLIELVIVLFIIGIIVAIFIPLITGNKAVNMGTEGGELLEASKPHWLVCTQKGKTTREPALPGETWTFENGVFVTRDVNGNSVTRGVLDKDCKVE